MEIRVSNCGEAVSGCPIIAVVTASIEWIDRGGSGRIPIGSAHGGTPGATLGGCASICFRPLVGVLTPNLVERNLRSANRKYVAVMWLYVFSSRALQWRKEGEFVSLVHSSQRII